MPAATERWTGRLPQGSDTWAAVEGYLTRTAGVAAEALAEGSPYGPGFGQGATIVPRVLFMVRPQQAGPLGLAAGRRAVRSVRSSTEKPPWRSLPDHEGVVEAEFIHPVLLGESVLPHRVLPPREAVLPLEGETLLDGSHAHLDRYPGLTDWWRSAEQQWLAHRSSNRMTLRERLDFRRGLTGQLPAPALRVVYGASGMHVAATLIDDPRVIIDKSLYWGTVTSRAEGRYLCAILNSPALTDLVRPLMSYGKDERHVDKHLWKLSIPRYDETDPQHRQLADLGHACAEHVKTLDLDEGGNFVTLRRKVRSALAAHPPAVEANALVVGLLAPRIKDQPAGMSAE